MYVLHLDQEQRDMLVAAATATDAFLGARLQRADPEGVLSASRTLQQAKMAQVILQLQSETPGAWDGLTLEAQAEVTRLFALGAQLGPNRGADRLVEAIAALLFNPANRRDLRADAKAPDDIER